MATSPSPDVRALLITAPMEEAQRLAEGLVEQEMCACVNLVPGLTSVYRWEGKVMKDTEALMIIKTTASGASAVRQFIEEKHSYDVPEVLALDINATDSSSKYLQWLAASVKVTKA